VSRDIKASLRFKWRAPWGGALPGEGLKSYVRRLASTPDRRDAADAQAWLERKGCRLTIGELIPVRAARPYRVEGPSDIDRPPKRSEIEKHWRACAALG
jgi:hypothetical protein